MSRLPRARAAAAVLAAAATLAVPAQAVAAPVYPPNPDSITVNTTSVTSGGSITVSAKTFEYGSDVDVTTALENDAALVGASTGGGRGSTGFVPLAPSGTCATGSSCTVVASATGVATATVALTEPGATNITMSGVGLDGEPLTQTVAVNVAGAAVVPVSDEAPTTDLATTGPRDLIQTVAIAIGMLAVGTVLVLFVRRRRDTVVTA